MILMVTMELFHLISSIPSISILLDGSSVSENYNVYNALFLLIAMHHADGANPHSTVGKGSKKPSKHNLSFCDRSCPVRNQIAESAREGFQRSNDVYLVMWMGPRQVQRFKDWFVQSTKGRRHVRGNRNFI